MKTAPTIFCRPFSPRQTMPKKADRTMLTSRTAERSCTLLHREGEENHQIGETLRNPTTTNEPLRLCHSDFSQRRSRIRTQGVITSMLIQKHQVDVDGRIDQPTPTLSRVIGAMASPVKSAQREAPALQGTERLQECRAGKEQRCGAVDPNDDQDIPAIPRGRSLPKPGIMAKSDEQGARSLARG